MLYKVPVAKLALLVRYDETAYLDVQGRTDPKFNTRPKSWNAQLQVVMDQVMSQEIIHLTVHYQVVQELINQNISLRTHKIRNLFGELIFKELECLVVNL